MLQNYERRFNRIAMFGLIAGFTLLIVVVATAFLTYGQNQASSERVEHTHRVINQVDSITLHVERAETAARGFLLAPDRVRLETFEANISKVGPTMAALDGMVDDNPLQERNVERLRQALEKEIRDVSGTVALAKQGRMDEAIADFRHDVALRRVVEIRTIAGQIAAEENRLLAQRRANEERSGRLLRMVLGGAALLMIGVGLFTVMLARRYTHDLTKARDRLHVLNTDLEGEVGRRTAELQRANDEIQRFAYIVSHDLRSPLVNILGFTAELETTNKSLGGLIERAEATAPELLTEDVRHAQEDLPEAIGFIRSSTQKMDRLINAILKLSREGRRTLTPELLPMDRVIGEIVDTLAQRIEDAEASVTVEPGLPDITSDRVAIEQIFSNMIENALKYGHSERPIEVKVRGFAEKTRLIYEIEDNGRGIDPKDHQRIFDLFRRSGVQDRAGEGIGLAQVRALVNRLGGFIDVKSQLGEGALFRLNFPKAYTDQGAGNE